MSIVKERVEILANRSLVIGLGLEVERLNILDDLWTSYLAEPHDPTELQDDFAALQAIVGEMLQLLSSVYGKSNDLRQLTREYPSDLDRELEMLVANHPARDWIIANRPPQPLAQTVIDACSVVQEETPAAMVELTEKIARIAAGQFEAGDFRLTLKCALTAVGLGAIVLGACATGGLIVLPAAVTAGAGIGGSVVSGVATLAGWNCQRPVPRAAMA